jgi:6-hydroxycyclohex-1-ene-1-carbonyl-CoA dehydrogenase
MEPIKAYGYFFEEAGAKLARKEFLIDPPADDEAVVKVAGCGLCHTDISFYTGQVKTRHMPLVLGHEISGEVVAAGKTFEGLQGKNVIIPAVLPCGECDMCRKGRGNVCAQQKMPGNDFNGGFASHIRVPARFLCELPQDLKGLKVSDFAVIADAVTTPYQALMRSNTQAGDLAVVIGVGGLGTYMVQLAKSAGAKVIAIDIDEPKLANALKMGADYSVNAKGLEQKEVKGAVRNLVKEHKLPRAGWRVFETSGTAPGQMIGFSLLSFAGTLGVIGFTMDKVNLRLSNIMAFDADVFGNWGCRPEYYPAVVEKVLGGDINIRDNIEEHPLDSINEIVPLALEHKLEKRVVFVP